MPAERPTILATRIGPKPYEAPELNDDLGHPIDATVHHDIDEHITGPTDTNDNDSTPTPHTKNDETSSSTSGATQEDETIAKINSYHWHSGKLHLIAGEGINRPDQHHIYIEEDDCEYNTDAPPL